MNHSVSNDELLIQRCVDGELQEAQQIELIQRLDEAENPEKWRTLALQYMEQQVLEEVFYDHQAEEPSLNLSDHKPELTTTAPARRSGIYRFAATIAVGLLLGLSLSLILKGQLSGQNTHQRIADQAHTNQTETGQARSNQGIATETRLVSQATGPNQTQTAPTFDVYEYPPADMYYQEANLPREVRQQLENLGYVIERHSRAYRLPLENGQEIIIPSDTIHVRYSGR